MLLESSRKLIKALNRFSILSLMLLALSCSSTGSENSNTSEEQQAEEIESKKKDEKKKTILFFGDSITAGYQLDLDQAFPALIQKRLDSLGYNYTTINAGLSGETSAGGVSRISWVLRTVPDIFFLELGANDGLRGLSLEETPKNLQTIIDEVKKANPDVKIIIAGMMVPPNLGQDYADKFFNLFPDIAEKNQAELIPFLLDGVAGIPELNLSDGIHPTPEGHAIVTETVWNHLRPLLEKASSSSI